MISFPIMRLVVSLVLTTIVLVSAAAASRCGGGGLGLTRQYEYEEEIYLELDGSARVVVNASVPALVALHGLDLRTDPRARFDRAQIRRMYEAPATKVMRVSLPWRRQGRRFVQVRLEVDDIRHLGKAPPFSWSRYEFGTTGHSVMYRQVVGQASDRGVGDAGWDGTELVAFRMHLPSKIEYHNAPSRRVGRGNILAWEQPLAERLAGKPLVIEARIDSRSILSRTLLVFASAFVAAIAALAGVIWWVVKRG